MNTILEKLYFLHSSDKLLKYRNNFAIPKHKNSSNELIYFCGNSLGLKPKSVDEHILNELKDWAQLGVEAHFKSNLPWVNYHTNCNQFISKLIGAKPSEVVVMNSLSVNLHLLMVSFYRPTPQKYKILIEKGAFPSDQYVVDSQARFHGFNPKDAIIEIPYSSNHYFDTNEIIDLIDKHKNELALILIGGVNYYTGQVFDIQKISKTANDNGIIIGYDLAHGIGNIFPNLNANKVDFATWCSYKYLNSGPGGVSGIYINEKHHSDNAIPRFEGWWGYRAEDRFMMNREFVPSQGAEAWQLSNAPILSMAAHLASLKIFDEVGIENLIQKSDLMFENMYEGLLAIQSKYKNCNIHIITPKNKGEHGCQISMLVPQFGKQLFEFLKENHVVADWRNPNVIRIAPVPLYNTFEEISIFLKIIDKFYQSQ